MICGRSSAGRLRLSFLWVDLPGVAEVVADHFQKQPDKSASKDSAGHYVEIRCAGRRLRAMTPDGILGLLIESYRDCTDDAQRFSARLDYACQARVDIQSLLMAGEMFEYSTPDESRVLRDRGPAPEPPSEWRCATPLVLVASFYEPAGELARPRTSEPGQIWWIDPMTASSLLVALHEVRWLDIIRPGGMQPQDRGPYRHQGKNGAAGFWRRGFPETPHRQPPA